MIIYHQLLSKVLTGNCDSTSYFNTFHTSLPPLIIYEVRRAKLHACSSQVIVQRTLAAKNLAHAKGGCIFAAALKVLPMFIIVYPGMISRVLFPDDVGCSTAESCMDVCGSTSGCSNVAFPNLVLNVMPIGKYI